jgi:hypothetical protein
MVMTTLVQVQRKAQTLKEALEKVQSNHFYWLKKTQPLLEMTLQAILSQTPLNWHVHPLSPECLQLALTNEEGQLTATLSYQLTYKSLVSIEASLHTMTYHPETRSEIIHNLYTLEPSLVDEGLINTSITQFIDLVLKEYSSTATTYKDLQAPANTFRIITRKPNP